MAERPFFYVSNREVRMGSVEFEWFPGFAVSQKQKSVASMHEALRSRGHAPLEVSTKSTEELGKKLSAFNLKLDGHYLENVFQSSKVFQNRGPYTDLLEVQPKEAKRDPRLSESGRLTAFRYQEEDWPLLPRTLFYDFIYLKAVQESVTPEELSLLKQYDSFTDIEFNPKRSINTQARSIAIVRLMCELYGSLPEVNQRDFLRFHRAFVKC